MATRKRSMSPTGRAAANTSQLDDVTLAELKALKEDSDLCTAEAQAAAAKFGAHVARAFRDCGAPIQGSAVCLECGSIRPRSLMECPDCRIPGVVHTEGAGGPQ